MNQRLHRTGIAACILAFSQGVCAQVAKPLPRSKVVMDLASGAMLDPLPFDEAFLLEGTVGGKLPQNTACVTSRITVKGANGKKDDTRPKETWTPIKGVEQESFAVVVDPLPPNREVHFEFSVYSKLNESQSAYLEKQAIERAWTLSADMTLEASAEALYEDYAAATLHCENLRQEFQLELQRAQVLFDAQSDLVRLSEEYKSRQPKLLALLNHFADTLKGQDLSTLASDDKLLLATMKDSKPDQRLLLSKGEAEWKKDGIKKYTGEIDPLNVKDENGGASEKARIAQLQALNVTLRKLQTDNHPATSENKEVVAAVEEIVKTLNAIEPKRKLRKDAAKQLASVGGNVAAQEVKLRADGRHAYKEHANLYLSMDLGIAAFPALKGSYAAPYIGTNIYVRPVNKSAPITRLDQSFSFLVGATLTSIEREGRREGLFMSSGLLLGFGFRLTRYVRLNSGAILFQAVDPNPLVDSKSLAASPFVAASLDVDVASIFKSSTKALFGVE